ncbi:MAG TPA: right-handed parallel beta-helix repeat-containing protein [Sedimentisphaerales bacterium]|nr:right-handed parallel beta-helix repeat-containing protein [Sedimentisphaerales bacterium]
MTDKTRLVGIVAAVMAFLALSAGSAQGGTITVGPGGGYDFTSIQAAIDAAGTGDTVIVYPHTYYENIYFLGKAITVKSINPQDPNIVAGTVIDAGGSGSAVTFENGEGPDAVITGFTITGGIGTYDNRVSVASYWGGGVYCYRASPTITSNVISGNIGLNDWDEYYHTYGGGIACLSSSAIIARNVIKENEAFNGGGIYIWDVRDVGANPTITNNIINGNEATYGAGIGVYGANATIANNLICYNSVTDSSQWPGDSSGIESDGGAHVIITNNILWGNLPPQIDDVDGTATLSVTYSNVEDGWPGEGNIDEDPLFVDAANGDYHLQVDSPCINAGDPGFVPQPGETDFEGNPRALLGRVDMGPYEFDGNLRPVADAGPDQAITDIPAQVTLDGSGSSDPNGDPLSYRWNQTFGPEVQIDDANAAITTFSPAEYGAYIFELVVNDGSLDSFADSVNIVIGNGRVPVADAGLPRYAATDPVELDGTGSYDPDASGALSYQWQQISGPTVTITDGNTPTPTISGFTPTDSIQRCEFQLIVGDGQYESLPGTVFVIIVHNRYSESSFRLESGTFDPEKPTLVAFRRGDYWGGGSQWNSRVNILSEITDTTYDYFRAGDKLILYLSSIAPSYSQPIQLSGCSGGAKAAIVVAGYMNRTYQDRRYAVNHVTVLDGGTSRSHFCQFLVSAVDGEQCWVDSYIDEYAVSQPRVLNVEMYQFGHCDTADWYIYSLWQPDMNVFNGGVIAGAYWSVFGPGKNLQLASTPDTMTYRFEWEGSTQTGYMDFYDESLSPGRLPEPVTLMVGGPTTGPNSAPGYLTCQESENAVGYQLLMGPDPYRVMDYNVVSDTPTPPNQVITTLPFEKTYWTIKARDQYGSTIYADPLYVDSFILTRPIENLSTGKRYGYIQHAVNEAAPGDEIVAKPGTYYESLDFKGKNLTFRSTNPDDPAVVAATVIKGDKYKSAVTFSGGENATCVLAGFVITGGKKGICCRDCYPTITNCRIEANAGAGIESTFSTPSFYAPRITNCAILANEGGGVRAEGRIAVILSNCLIAANRKAGVDAFQSPIIANCTIVGNELVGISSYSGQIHDCIVWANSSAQIVNPGAHASVTHCDVQGGCSGEGNIDADPLFVDAASGDFHLSPGSPAIDAGHPLTDWSNEPWPNGGRANMGAYGNTKEATRSSAGFQDLAQLCAYWLEYDQPLDIAPQPTGDGIINFLDYATLADWWLLGP